MTARRRVRVLYPHQLHESQLGAERGTRFVLVEDDLLFRSQPFHAQKLVLHRAAGRHFVDRLREAGFDVDVVETDAGRSSGERLAEHLAAIRPDELKVYDPVDRATNHVYGRRMRTANSLRHVRPLARGWWDGTTGLDPVDHVVEGVLERGWAHHIERLMVLGNAMCLLRTDPVEVYRWFMAMFVDAYDWVMVPNVHAMSQFAVGAALTTKPYVSGSAYLRRMSDFGPGEWRDDWDALYWTFVDDHRDVFDGNPRSRMAVRTWESMDAARREALVTRGRAVIDRL